MKFHHWLTVCATTLLLLAFGPASAAIYNYSAVTDICGAGGLTITVNAGDTVNIADTQTTCGTGNASGMSARGVFSFIPNGADFIFRVVTNAAGVGTGTVTWTGGNVFSITVVAATPTAVTSAATAVSAFGATLNGQVSSNGNGAATTVSFDYGLTTAYGAAGSPATAAQSPLASNATGMAVSAAITGLSCNTTYHYRVNANNGVGGTVNGADMSFATAACVPGAPAIGTASAGNAQAVVTFTAPASDGGSAVTGYTFTSSPAGGIDSNAGSTGLSHVITGLANGTAYTFTVTATNAVGTGAASAASNSVTPASPSYTGPSPTGGGNITAVLSGGGATCVYGISRFIAVSGGVGSPPAGTAPAGFTFPQGLFDFTTTGCTPGGTITLSVTYPQALPAATVYWKYGPTAATPAPHWYQIPATIAGNTAVFSITDGGLGDDDLAANGTIVDQGGPGVPGAPGGLVGVPTLSEWSRILLVGMLAMLAMWVLRRRRMDSPTSS